jgi:hypothetical protein
MVVLGQCSSTSLLYNCCSVTHMLMCLCDSISVSAIERRVSPGGCELKDESPGICNDDELLYQGTCDCRPHTAGNNLSVPKYQCNC